jgi:uncharacterized delta-60 repeat protein
MAVADMGTGTLDAAYAVAVQRDGKIVAAGAALTKADYDFALARFNPDGRLDLTFDRDGKVTTDLGGTERALGVAIHKDGKILAAGHSGDDCALARYQKNGRLDRSFSNDGKALTDFGGEDFCPGLALQPDGRVIVAGTSYAAGTASPALARYQKDGRLDRSFAGDGKVLTDLGFPTAVYSVALQPDGRIVVAGIGSPETDADFLVARYLKTGQLDTSFSTDGWSNIDFGGIDGALDAAIQADGRIVAVGVKGGVDEQVAVARYLAQ